MSTFDAARRPRIASLLPSATEIVCALGAAEDLVGVSHECDFPAAAVGKRVLTSSKVIRRGTSGAIDRDVRRVLREALAVYDVDVDGLREVAPDVIVTQDLCDVCAVSLDDVVGALKVLAREDAVLVNLHPTRLDEIFGDIESVGAALGRGERAREVVAALRARVAAIATRSKALATRPNVLTIEWIDPVMVGGTWMPELVELAGGRALVTQAGDHAPTLDAEALKALDPAPDVVLVKPCGFELERTFDELDTLRELFASVRWPAVQRGDVWLADGNAFFNRPGPRIVESLEILAACVHPSEFADFATKHAGSFVRFEQALARR